MGAAVIMAILLLRMSNIPDCRVGDYLTTIVITTWHQNSWFVLALIVSQWEGQLNFGTNTTPQWCVNGLDYWTSDQTSHIGGKLEYEHFTFRATQSPKRLSACFFPESKCRIILRTQSTKQIILITQFTNQIILITQFTKQISGTCMFSRLHLLWCQPSL